MNSVTSQLKQVLRRLWRAPLFTIVTLITLAAGVGANIAVFSVVEGVLLKPLPYPHAETLVGVWHTAPGLNLDEVNMAPSNYFIYREQNRVFQDIGVYEGDSVAVTKQGSPEQVQALDVTDGVLPVLGVTPMLGRWFNRADVTPNAAETVMLAYGYWQRRFGSDRSIVGKTITVDGKARQVIGDAAAFSFSGWRAAGAVFAIAIRSEQDGAGAVQFRRDCAVAAGRDAGGSEYRYCAHDSDGVDELSRAAGFQRGTLSQGIAWAEGAAAEQGCGGRCWKTAVGPDGKHRCGVADCVRECGEPAAGTRGRTAPGIGGARGSGREPVADCERFSAGERRDRCSGKRTGPGTGVRRAAAADCDCTTGSAAAAGYRR